MASIVDDTRTLVTATAGIAEEKVIEARKRVVDALESAKDLQRQAAKAANKVLRDRPYQALGAALAVGLIIGLFARRRD
jgi:ElaB/YqjD/DUF883 family membrane-anchored ribosome-binding protein